MNNPTPERSVEEIIRYSPVLNGDNEMLADPKGEYVKYSDLQAERQKRDEVVTNILNEIKDCNCQGCRRLEMKITQSNNSK